MHALFLSFGASVCTALSSLSFRKNADGSSASYTSSGYLVLYFFSSFIFSLILYPEIFKSNINYIILFIGICVGVLSSSLMLLTSRALKFGPAGLTFAFLNASAIFPGLILFLSLGSKFGFTCSLLQLGGMVLVLSGLFLGARKESASQPQASSQWLKYALGCFLVQILALTCIQARCVLFNCNEISGVSFNVTEADDIWFMPGQFGASFVMQAAIFLWERKRLQLREVIYGCLGGVANFASTCLLLLATKFASSFEKGILFPCFAVGAMILCNIWANRLYKENFNFRTNALCSFGIFMAVAG